MGLAGGLMGIHGWKKVIATTVLIAFIGMGLAWAMEQGSPQFQEKESMPVVKKHKSALLPILLGAAAVGAIIYLLTLKKKDNPIPPGPTPQTYTVKIYNIMKSDVQRTITFDSLPNASKSFSSTDLSISGVYDKYIVMREEGSNNELGQWLAFGKDKSVSFTTPTNTTLCAYFFDNMDNGRNDLYDKMIDKNGNVEIPPGRDSSWYRFDTDGQSGPQSVWDHAAAQLNTALAYAFKVGSISATGGTKHKYGYRFCEGGDGYKSFTEFWVGVNSDKIGLNYIIPLERVALEEWFEYATYSNNIDNIPSHMTICDSGKSDMNTTGIRLLRAMYTAHNKNVNFSN
jgi:hypothetical protein